MSSELPKGWVEARLRDIVTSVKGKSPIHLSGTEREGYVPYLDVRALETGEIRSFAESDSSQILDGSEIAVLWDGARSGSVFQARKGALGSTLVALRPLEVEPRFLLHYLKWSYAVVNSSMQGSSIPHVDPSVFWELKVPLPPLAEQRRIVAEIETAFARLAAQRMELEALRAKLKAYRESILSDAFAGAMTENWRKRNPNEPKAPSLSSRRYFSAMPHDSLPPLPSTWRWEALGDFAQCSRGRFSARPRNDPQYFGGETPFIQIGDLPPNGGWILSHKQTLNSKGLNVSKLFPKGTAVVAIVGATIGNTGLLAYDMCFPDSLVGLCAPTETMTRFVELFLRSQKHLLREIAYGGGGQPNIKLGTLNPHPLPVPPIREQAEIVRLLEEQIAAAESSEADTRRIEETISEMSRQTLAQAFRGELVPQAPEDEPAALLLARIQAITPEPRKRNIRKPGTHRTMKKGSKLPRRPLLDVLQNADGRLTSTELFRQAGYDYESVDLFYEELKRAVAAGEIKEERPSRSESYLLASSTADKKR